MNTTNESIARFSRAHHPNVRAGERSTWICIDERHALLNGLRLWGKSNEGRFRLLDRRKAPSNSLLYKQTAAGNFGIGQDTHISLRMARSRNRHHSERPLAPAHVQGSMAAKVARIAGIDLLNHEGCAAEANALPIANTIATGRGPLGEDLLDLVRAVSPKPFKKSRFNHISDMFAEALEDGMLAPPEISAATLDHGGIHENQELLPVGRVPLADMPHIADTHVIDWGKRTAFDVEAAVRATEIEDETLTRYHASMGDMGDVYSVIRNDLYPGIDELDFIDVSFIRNVATNLHLPKQRDATPELILVR